MALTSHSTSLVRALMNKKLYSEAMKDIFFVSKNFAGRDENNIIIINDQPKLEAGQSISFGLNYRMTGDGVTGDNELLGNGESLNFYAQTIAIDQIRNAVELKGRLDESKSAYDLREVAKIESRRWLKEFIEKNIMMKLGGVTETDLTDVSSNTYSGRATWSNTAAAVPAADQTDGEGSRYLRSARSGSGDGLDDLAAGDVFTLDLIYKAKAKAKGTTPRMKPIIKGGDELWALVLHPYQVYDLKTASSGVNWNQINRESGPRNGENDIRTGALGVIDNVALFEHDLIPTCQASSDFDASGPNAGVRAYRALFLGAGALCWTEGRVPGQATSMFMEEDTKDVKNKAIFAAGFIGGMQKLTFNSIDNGVIAIDTSSSLA